MLGTYTHSFFVSVARTSICAHTHSNVLTVEPVSQIYAGNTHTHSHTQFQEVRDVPEPVRLHADSFDFKPEKLLCEEVQHHI